MLILLSEVRWIYCILTDLLGEHTGKTTGQVGHFTNFMIFRDRTFGVLKKAVNAHLSKLLMSGLTWLTDKVWMNWLDLVKPRFFSYPGFCFCETAPISKRLLTR